MRFLTLDLKTKLITTESTFRRSLCGMVVDKMLDLKTKLILTESTFRRSLCGMVVDKMLNSKAEIDIAFFLLTLILFSLVAIGK